MKTLLSLSLLALLLSSCADPNQVAISALENEDYSNIQLTGFGWFSCKDQRQFDRKEEYRNKLQRQDKTPIIENDSHYDVMQSFTPSDWGNF